MSNMPIQQMNMRAMIEFARGQGGVQFAYRGIDPTIQKILDSSHGKRIAFRKIVEETNFVDLADDWFDARKAQYWQPYSPAEFRQHLFSRVDKHWNPGGFGTQNWDFVNPVSIVSYTTVGGRIWGGRQPFKDHYPRVLPWIDMGLWDIYPGQQAAKEYIEKLYSKTINPRTGGWK